MLQAIGLLAVLCRPFGPYSRGGTLPAPSMPLNREVEKIALEEDQRWVGGA